MDSRLQITNLDLGRAWRALAWNPSDGICGVNPGNERIANGLWDVRPFGRVQHRARTPSTLLFAHVTFRCKVHADLLPVVGNVTWLGNTLAVGVRELEKTCHLRCCVFGGVSGLLACAIVVSFFWLLDRRLLSLGLLADSAHIGWALVWGGNAGG